MKKTVIIIVIVLLMLVSAGLICYFGIFKGYSYECTMVESYKSEDNITYDINNKILIDISKTNKVSKYYKGIEYTYNNEAEMKSDIKDYEADNINYIIEDNLKLYVYNDVSGKNQYLNDGNALLDELNKMGYQCKKSIKF